MARARPFLLFFGVVTPCAGATVAMCQSDWEWVSNSLNLPISSSRERPSRYVPSAKSFNSYGNNPCEIAGFLDAECQGFGTFEPTSRFRCDSSRSTGAYAVGPLEQGTHYITPQRYTSAQGCECNTVMYRYTANLCTHPHQALTAGLCSLYMACTACQNVSTQPWSFWVQNCDSVYVSEYPGNIPLHTAVPNWAYVNVTVRARCQLFCVEFSCLTSGSRVEVASILQSRGMLVIGQREVYHTPFHCLTT